MEQFGEALKKERESRGIALEAITEATKISQRHLVALEHEQFDQLPGGVFNKGIVRSYARVVGLDEEVWVGRYLAAYQQSQAISDDDISWFAFADNVSRSRQEQRDQPAARLRWAGVFVLLTVLAAVAYFVYVYVHQRLIALPEHAAVARVVLRKMAAADTLLPHSSLVAATGLLPASPAAPPHVFYNTSIHRPELTAGRRKLSYGDVDPTFRSLRSIASRRCFPPSG